MKTFREYLRESEDKEINEATTLVNDNARNMSSELEVHVGGYGKDGKDTQLIIYINAGTAYRYELETTPKLEELSKKSRSELAKYSDQIGKKVQKLIEDELSKLIK